MYELTAVFNKSVLIDVLEEFEEVGIAGVTIVDVIDKDAILRKNEVTPEPKVMIKVVVSNDESKEVALEAIRASTMGLGSGKMWVKDVSDVERMRTGEKGEDALTKVLDKENVSEAQDAYYGLDTPAT